MKGTRVAALTGSHLLHWCFWWACDQYDGEQPHRTPACSPSSSLWTIERTIRTLFAIITSWTLQIAHYKPPCVIITRACKELIKILKVFQIWCHTIRWVLQDAGSVQPTDGVTCKTHSHVSASECDHRTGRRPFSLLVQPEERMLVEHPMHTMWRLEDIENHICDEQIVPHPHTSWPCDRKWI